MSTDPTASHRFSADRAVESRADDLLGRAEFAGSLATAIADWRQPDSLVVAIAGPWGSGKSSVKNMAIEALRAHSPAPKVVEFTPWQWAGQDELAEAFFHEVGIALGQLDKTRAGKRRAAKWRRYALRLQIGQASLKGLRNVFAGTLGVLGALGLLSLVRTPVVTTITAIMGAIAIVVGAVLAFGGDVANRLSSLFAAEAEAATRSLPDTKAELATALQSMATPLVVVIDDLDRLSPAQLRLMFQLVKANADFPRMVYLLLFDRGIVEAALDNTATSGRDYLNKIVQVNFDLPALERTRLDRVLFAKLDELLTEGRMSERFDQTRWGNIYLGSLQLFFQTLRDVNRFIATLSFQMGLLTTDVTLEVNPIDLIALEVLRHFEPAVYHACARAKQPLTSTSIMSAGGTSDANRSTVHGIVAEATLVHREAVERLLKELFPPAEQYFGGAHYHANFADGWFRDLRACHKDVFDRCFYLALPESDLSQTTIDRVLEASADRRELAAVLRALQSQGMLEIAIDRLEAYKQAIPVHRAVPLVTALFDIGDELREGSSFFDLTPAMHAIRVIHWHLKQEDDKAKRQEVLLTALRDTVGLVLPIQFIGLEVGNAQARSEAPSNFLLDADQVGPLQDQGLAMLRAAAADGRLSQASSLPMLLFRWREWGPEQEPRDWIHSLVTSDQGFVALLRSFVSVGSRQAMGSYVSEPIRRIRLGDMEPFLTVDELKRRFDELDESEATGEDDRQALGALRRALDRRERGIPDDALDAGDE